MSVLVELSLPSKINILQFLSKLKLRAVSINIITLKKNIRQSMLYEEE